MPDCARRAQLKGPVDLGSRGARNAPLESLWSRPHHRLAHLCTPRDESSALFVIADKVSLTAVGSLRKAHSARKSFGSRLRHFTCTAEFRLSLQIASARGEKGWQKSFGSRPVCRFTRAMGGPSRRQRGEQESLRSRLFDSDLRAQFTGAAETGSGGAWNAPSESLWSRLRVALPIGWLTKCLARRRKVDGR